MNGEIPQEASTSDFEGAAELFGVLATPIRLRIIGALCDGEKTSLNCCMTLMSHNPICRST